METTYLLSLTAVMAGITLALRATPFIALKDRNKPFLRFLGSVMPPGIMVILVFYSLTALKPALELETLATLASVITVIAVHHFYRNPLLSILSGTLLNLFILNYS